MGQIVCCETPASTRSPVTISHKLTPPTTVWMDEGVSGLCVLGMDAMCF